MATETKDPTLEAMEATGKVADAVAAAIEAAFELPALTKQQIVDAKDVQGEWVPVPEWGGRVFVGVMTGKEKDEYEQSLMKGKGKARKVSPENIRAKVAAACIKDPQTGERMFSPGEIGVLAKKSGKALDHVLAVASRLNGLAEEDMEELVGNSDSDPSDDS